MVVDVELALVVVELVPAAPAVVVVRDVVVVAVAAGKIVVVAPRTVAVGVSAAVVVVATGAVVVVAPTAVVVVAPGAIVVAAPPAVVVVTPPAVVVVAPTAVVVVTPTAVVVVAPTAVVLVTPTAVVVVTPTAVVVVAPAVVVVGARVVVVVEVGVGAQKGAVILLLSRVTAAFLASSRPLMTALVFAVMAVRARIVPTNVEPTPSVAELPTCQKTLQAWAPLMSWTVLLGAVMRVEPAWKMKTELASPWPSSVSVPVKDRDEGDL